MDWRTEVFCEQLIIENVQEAKEIGKVLVKLNLSFNEGFGLVGWLVGWGFFYLFACFTEKA